MEDSGKNQMFCVIEGFMKSLIEPLRRLLQRFIGWLLTKAIVWLKITANEAFQPS